MQQNRYGDKLIRAKTKEEAQRISNLINSIEKKEEEDLHKLEKEIDNEIKKIELDFDKRRQDLINDGLTKIHPIEQEYKNVYALAIEEYEKSVKIAAEKRDSVIIPAKSKYDAIMSEYKKRSVEENEAFKSVQFNRARELKANMAVRAKAIKTKAINDIKDALGDNWKKI